MIFQEKEWYGAVGMVLAGVGFGSLFGWEWGIITVGGCFILIYLIKAIHQHS